MYANGLMIFQRQLGEFTAPENDPDWVHKIQFIERRPVQIKGSMNPWELERVRALWEAEKATWQKILPLKAEYAKVETSMRALVVRYNNLIQEFEKLTGKKMGIQEISSYGSMALAILPGFGWAAAVIGLLGPLLGMTSGKKKKIESKMRELETVQAEIGRLQGRLLAIQQEIAQYMQVTEQVKGQQAAIMQADIQRTEQVRREKQVLDAQSLARHRAEVQAIRAQAPKRVLSYEGGQL